MATSAKAPGNAALDTIGLSMFAFAVRGGPLRSDGRIRFAGIPYVVAIGE
jgi:hypothetical protein